MTASPGPGCAAAWGRRCPRIPIAERADLRCRPTTGCNGPTAGAARAPAAARLAVGKSRSMLPSLPLAADPKALDGCPRCQRRHDPEEAACTTQVTVVLCPPCGVRAHRRARPCPRLGFPRVRVPRPLPPGPDCFSGPGCARRWGRRCP